MIVLLRNNLWNKCSTSSWALYSWETYNRTLLVDNFYVFVKDILKLVSYITVVWLVIVLQTFNVIENVLNLLHVFGYNPKFRFGIIQTFNFYVLNLVYLIFLFSPLELLLKEVKNKKVQAPYIISPWKILYFEFNLTKNFLITILLWALSEAKETVPLNSTFAR